MSLQADNGKVVKDDDARVKPPPLANPGVKQVVSVPALVRAVLGQLVGDRRVWLLSAGLWVGLTSAMFFALVFSGLVLGVGAKLYFDYKVDRISRSFESSKDSPRGVKK